MSATIVTETIGGVEDRRIALSNDSLARPHGLGVSWNVLRIGLRLQLEPTPGNASILTGYPILFIGLCSGTTNPFGTVNCTNAYGYTHYPQPATNGNWGFGLAGGGNMTAYGSGNSVYCFSIKHVAGVQTLGGIIQNGGVTYWSADPTAATRRMFFVDIARGTPNFSLRAFSCNSQTAAPDVTTTDFLNQVVAPTPAFTNHSLGASGEGALAFSESNGVLDCVNISWNKFVRVHICDLAVVKLS
jgi:hypothetical protein